MTNTLVFQHDKIKLYHYESQHKKKHAIPLLIVFATINRPDILDLFPEQSFIQNLIAQGIDVYLLDWGYPDANDAEINFANYVTKYLNNSVNFILKSNQCEKINLLGICQGGVISVCYAALHENINKLILISTPIDFHTKDNRVTEYFKNINTNGLPTWPGNIPGLALTQFFNLLRPLESMQMKYIKFSQQLSDQKKVEKFIKIEKWLYDAPDQPAKAFNEFITNCYQHNSLCKGELNIEGKKVKLENIKIPVLNIMAKNDEIVPPSASRALKKHIDSALYTQQYYPSGHIGIYVSDQLCNKLPTSIARWIKKSN